MSAQETMNTTTKKAANSIVGKLTTVILAGAAAVLAASAPAYAQSGENVLVVGDSLQVGTGPYLEQALGPEVSVDFDDRQSRRTDEGLVTLRSRIRPEHTVVVFDLGTNDDPRNPDAFYSVLNAARDVAGDRCLVVATLLRSPYKGVSVDGMNAAVERFALDNPGVQVADWYGIATSTPGILYKDGIHARPEGYALRGRLIADAVAGCGDAGAAGEIPAPSNPAPKPPPEPQPEPEPPPQPEVELKIRPPGPIVAIAATIRQAASLLSAAGDDVRWAAGLGPPEPVLGAG
jgi:hypothetical protein